MIYLFGIGEQVSVIMNERYLTEAERKNATLVVEELPVKDTPDGFYEVLYIDPETKELKYIYKEKTPEMTRYDKLQQMVNEGKITQEEMNELL